MFTFDRQGFEQNEWTIDKRRTPAIRICDRADFKDILANRVWYLKPEDALKAERPRFQIASVHSRVTGEYLAAITKALDPEPKGSSSQGVIAMATPLLSLIRPVLPPDFGFAIIDQSGNVQFHSDPSKNGQENFLDEVRDGRDLRAAVAARHDRLLTVSYLGFEHRVFVSPISSIQQCPWSLIVFSTLSNISVQRIERMLLFSTLALFYYAIVIVPVALGLYFWTRRHGGRRFHRGDAPNEHHEPDSAQSHSWTCPCDEDRGEYRHLALSLILVVCSFYALIFGATVAELQWCAALVPLCTLVAIERKMMRKERHLMGIACLIAILAIGGLLWHIRINQERGWNAFGPLSVISFAYFLLCSERLTERLVKIKKAKWPTSFSAACFLLLILTTVLPCIAFFRLSYDYVENVATRREQLLTMAAFRAREDRVINRYVDVQTSGQSPLLAQDFGKTLFLRHRFAEQIDLYDAVFRDQHVGQKFEPGRHETANPLPDSPPWLLSLASSFLQHVPLLHIPGSLTNELGKRDGKAMWEWYEDGTNRILMRSQEPEIDSSPETSALKKLVNKDPHFFTRDLTYGLGVLQSQEFLFTMWPLLLILLAPMFWSLRSTLQLMFLQNRSFGQPFQDLTLDDAIAENGNFVLLGLPGTGKTQMLESQGPKIMLIDLADVLRSNKGDRRFNSNVVALDHFEFGIDDPKTNLAKLELIEELVLRRRKKVIIVTTVDPNFHLLKMNDGNPPNSSADHQSDAREGWAKVLAHFETRRLKTQKDKVPQSHYPLLWSALTWTERAAADSLACRGWANHKNYAALEHLWKRGLISRNSSFAVTDPGFASFIRAENRSNEHKQWRMRDRSAGSWEGLRLMFFILLASAVVAVLFFNEHEIIAYVASGVSALAPITKMISEVRGKSRSKAAEGA